MSASAWDRGGEFAFVLFSLAMALGVMPMETGQMMLAVVALSMALTPFLMTAGRRLAVVLTPKMELAELRRTEADARDFKGHVIIAGFGRVGQTVARLLEAQRLPYMAFDLEPSRIAEGRARGLPIYYGDASRAEVLKAAGVNRARAAVVTLDQPWPPSAPSRLSEGFAPCSTSMPAPVTTNTRSICGKLAPPTWCPK
jgi:monovalent cation:H+ antiporter-2, CPA2 family